MKYDRTDFEEDEITASLIEQLGKSEVQEFYERVFESQSKSGKLSVQIYGKGMLRETLGVASEREWKALVSSRTMLASETFQARDEKQLYDASELRKASGSYWRCSYSVGSG